jgi:hypothetical protein
VAYTVRRVVDGMVTMCGPWDPTTRTYATRQEPRQTAYVKADGVTVATVELNGTLLCLPEGGVRGVDGTDEQIIRAVLGDEHIFTGAPTFPTHHDAVQQLGSVES